MESKLYCVECNKTRSSSTVSDHKQSSNASDVLLYHAKRTSFSHSNGLLQNLKSKFVPILPILRLFLFSDFNTILRSFRLYDYNICYSLILHDSPIFPIIRSFRSLFCDFSDSLSSTRFSDFSDYTILPIVILRSFRFS